MAFADRAFAYVSVAATSLAKKTSGVLLNLRAFAGSFTDTGAEASDEEPVYGVPGVFVRPRDPDADPKIGGAEYIAARTTDGLTPIAGRDLRISTARGNVNKGSVGIGGYGKGFLALEDESTGGGNTFVLYVPYAFSNGVPSKAHTFTIDSKPNGETIVLLHGSKAYFSISPTGVISLVSPSGQQFITVSDEGVAVSGAVKMTTGAVIGAVAGAKPVIIAPDGSAQWFAQVNAAISAIKGAGAVAAAPAIAAALQAVIIPTAPVPVISAKASASP